MKKVICNIERVFGLVGEIAARKAKSLFALQTVVLSLALGSHVSAAPDKEAGIQYKNSSDGEADRQQLDVYYDSNTAQLKKPVVVWVHGGAWKFGSKENHLEKKAEWLVGQGYVLVAVNYRLFPQVDYKSQCSDIVSAMKWVTNNVAEYGGDASRVAVMGHSAGGHLAALSVMDRKYLRNSEESTTVKVVVTLDSGGLDIPLMAYLERPRVVNIYTEVFGASGKERAKASPIHYVRRDGLPKFLLITLANRANITKVAASFQSAVVEKEGTCEHETIEDATHESLNQELGSEGDLATEKVQTFLDLHLKN